MHAALPLPMLQVYVRAELSGMQIRELETCHAVWAKAACALAAAEHSLVCKTKQKFAVTQALDKSQADLETASQSLCHQQELYAQEDSSMLSALSETAGADLDLNCYVGPNWL